MDDTNKQVEVDNAKKFPKPEVKVIKFDESVVTEVPRSGEPT